MLISAIRRAVATTVTLFPGDGVGPEISDSCVDILNAVGTNINWDVHQIQREAATAEGDLISYDALNSLKENKLGLKGPFMTPIGKGYRSLNVTLRKRLQLYANVRPCLSLEGVNTKYKGVDLVTIRENTEGEYSGLEHEVVDGVIENLKIISELACDRIAKYAFEYAAANGRKAVSAVHKATVMKMGDGLFLRKCRDTSDNFSDVKYSECNVDSACMMLVSDPSIFDVMVMPNLYGDIVSDLCAGLVGGLGLTPSGNIGEDCALFEAVHGTAPDIAGKNKANPTALLLSCCMMLDHMEQHELAERIREAIKKTLSAGTSITGDLGGNASTIEYTQAVINNL